ncbi:MAG: multicomponent Na+:H+ antiporter subunit D [Elusimicrobia bacterium]|nr:MAG: multicomponent Na+:H+ antiporter subunit D [Elusimicrobiota bacterium]KAF0157324.1 MAG: multicomponent Na+:H+ antiporter subunit D [Elusimicrobiota bacterium]
MSELLSFKPLYAVLASLAAGLLVSVSGRRPRLRESFTLAGAAAKFGIIISMLPAVLAGHSFSTPGLEVFPGMELRLKADALGMVFAAMSSFLWILVSVYSVGYLQKTGEERRTRFFAFFAFTLSAAAGLAFSANLFTAFVFYELITLATYPLVAHKQTKEAMESGRIYLAYLLGTSLTFMLAAILITYNAAGTLDFVPGGIFGELAAGNKVLLGTVFFLFIAGTAKAAIMPLHSWLPAAMVAPAPVSALLHAVAVVKAGVFLVLKVTLHVFGAETLRELGFGGPLAWIASFTIIAASVMALTQDNLKLRLAYSTVSQLSYVVLGAALLSPSALKGAVAQLAAHGFAKITLFLAAGAIYALERRTKVSELDGIGRRMPLTMTAFSLCALSMIGAPPLAGFISKWHIGLGAVEAGRPVFLAVIGASALLNAAYFLPIIYRAFWGRPGADHGAGHGAATESGAAAMMMVVPLVITAAVTLALFFFPGPLLKLAELAAGG